MLLTIVSLEERESSSFQTEWHGKHLSQCANSVNIHYDLRISTHNGKHTIGASLYFQRLSVHHGRKHGGMSVDMVLKK